MYVPTDAYLTDLGYASLEALWRCGGLTKKMLLRRVVCAVTAWNHRLDCFCHRPIS